MVVVPPVRGSCSRSGGQTRAPTSADRFAVQAERTDARRIRHPLLTDPAVLKHGPAALRRIELKKSNKQRIYATE
jgi:hypothetical protein